MCLLGFHLRWGISARALGGALHGPHDMLISGRVSLTTRSGALIGAPSGVPSRTAPSQPPSHAVVIWTPFTGHAVCLSPSSSPPAFYGAANGKTPLLSDRTAPYDDGPLPRHRHRHRPLSTNDARHASEEGGPRCDAMHVGRPGHRPPAPVLPRPLGIALCCRRRR